MNKRKFNWFQSGVCAVGTLLALAFMEIQREVATDISEGRALWVGAFFLMVFVFGFIGLQLAIITDKKYKVERPSKWWMFFLIACVMIFGVSTVGQYLFMYSKEVVPSTSDVDMVILLDASGSMESSGYEDARTEAACKFVDSLSDDCRLQAVSFAGTIIDESQLLVMDSSGKDTIKKMISNIDAAGSTDFNEPLREAMKVLNEQGRKNCNKAVILLTDGQGNLNSQLVNDYINSDIRVFTVRISSFSGSDALSKALIKLADDTNGFDKQLVPDVNGNIYMDDMLEAFKKAFDAVSESIVSMKEDLLIYAQDGITLMQFIIRLMVMALCSIIISIGYFCRFDRSSVISGVVMGVVTAVLVTVFEKFGYYPSAISTCFLIGTAWVFMDEQEGDVYDV